MKYRLYNTGPLSVGNQIIALYASSHNGDHLCHVIMKKNQRFKNYGADIKLFNTWLLSVVLTYVVATHLPTLSHNWDHLCQAISFFKK
jgi:hypothetical protein